jgi:hypothetical protein
MPGRPRQALCPRLSRFLQLLCLFRQGRNSCERTYQPPFPSSLLFARSPRATCLRLCVGPAMQVSQALPRGGAESDFSALMVIVLIIYTAYAAAPLSADIYYIIYNIFARFSQAPVINNII